jgi:hypothetical protein
MSFLACMVVGVALYLAFEKYVMPKLKKLKKKWFR